MFHPTRDGCRGGRDKFNWEEIRTDRHRQSYLGNSIHAPHSRYGKDLYWYSRDNKPSTGCTKESELQEELRSQKQRESKLMEFYLKNGFGAQPPPELLETTSEIQGEQAQPKAKPPPASPPSDRPRKRISRPLRSPKGERAYRQDTIPHDEGKRQSDRRTTRSRSRSPLRNRHDSRGSRRHNFDSRR